MGEGVFAVSFTAEAHSNLRTLKVFDARRVAGAIVASLTHQPFQANRNRKQLDGVEPSFGYDPPLWELRVGDFRVFYDGNVAEQTLTIRAIRLKGPTQSTQEILS